MLKEREESPNGNRFKEKQKSDGEKRNLNIKFLKFTSSF